MYECVICQSLNHTSRLHCQNCGTIPAIYSWSETPRNQENREVTAAHGCVRVNQKQVSRINLRTAVADYSLGEQKMYIYLFKHALFPSETRKVVTDFPVRDKELLERLVNSMSYSTGWYLLEIHH